MLQLLGHHITQFLREIYSRILERRLRLFNLRSRKKNADSVYSIEVDLFFILNACLWGVSHSVFMCFVDLEKDFDHVPLRIL